MRRRLFLLRVRIHDWMWQGGRAPRNPVRRAARHLPLYLSDPHWVSPEEFDATLNAPTSFREVRFVEAPQTWGTGTGINLRLNFTDPDA